MDENQVIKILEFYIKQAEFQLLIVNEDMKKTELEKIKALDDSINFIKKYQDLKNRIENFKNNINSLTPTQVKRNPMGCVRDAINNYLDIGD